MMIILGIQIISPKLELHVLMGEMLMLMPGIRRTDACWVGIYVQFYGNLLL